LKRGKEMNSSSDYFKQSADAYPRFFYPFKVKKSQIIDAMCSKLLYEKTPKDIFETAEIMGFEKIYTVAYRFDYTTNSNWEETEYLFNKKTKETEDGTRKTHSVQFNSSVGVGANANELKKLHLYRLSYISHLSENGLSNEADISQEMWNYCIKNSCNAQEKMIFVVDNATKEAKVAAKNTFKSNTNNYADIDYHHTFHIDSNSIRCGQLDVTVTTFLIPLYKIDYSYGGVKYSAYYDGYGRPEDVYFDYPKNQEKPKGIKDRFERYIERKVRKKDTIEAAKERWKAQFPDKDN